MNINMKPDLHKIALQTIEDMKANNIIDIDISEKSSFCDYIIIATSTSDRHGRSIAENIVKKVKDFGLGTPAIEGGNTGAWMLIDLGNTVVHIFQEETRSLFRLEEIYK